MHRLIFIFVLVAWANAAEIRGGAGEAVDLYYMCFRTGAWRKELSPVILLHGLSADGEDWGGIFEVLALRTNRTVCMTDARSHGHSPQTEEFSLRLNAMDTIRFMDIMNFSRAILVGHSMGGKTAGINALYNPERVEKLVVEDQRPNSINPDVRASSDFQVRALRKALALVPDGATEDEAADIVYRSIKESKKQELGLDEPETERETWRRRIERVDGRWRYVPEVDRLIKIITDPDAVDGSLKGRFEGEALFIYGKLSDSKLDLVEDEIREQFPKAVLLAVEGAQHNIHHDFPREFLTAVIDLINGPAAK